MLARQIRGKGWDGDDGSDDAGGDDGDGDSDGDGDKRCDGSGYLANCWSKSTPLYHTSITEIFIMIIIKIWTYSD